MTPVLFIVPLKAITVIANNSHLWVSRIDESRTDAVLWLIYVKMDAVQ